MPLPFLSLNFSPTFHLPILPSSFSLPSPQSSIFDRKPQPLPCPVPLIPSPAALTRYNTSSSLIRYSFPRDMEPPVPKEEAPLQFFGLCGREQLSPIPIFLQVFKFELGLPSAEVYLLLTSPS